MNFFFISILCATIALTSCSSSSGSIKIGPDTFTISAAASPGKGGIPAAKKIAYQEAARECMSQEERELFVLSEKSSSPSWTEGMANIEINFRCLPKTDPEFLRQNMKSTPDKIIEMRDR